MNRENSSKDSTDVLEFGTEIEEINVEQLGRWE